MEFIIDLFQQYGLWGLIIISFVESFISPIMPDILLIPMSLADPDKALFYSFVVTFFSIIGGFVGYWIGKHYGQPLFETKVPPKYGTRITRFFDKYGSWAVFLASLAPIPYKFVAISAGVFRINWIIFVILSILGRAKRFLIIGILIKYYGETAISLVSKYSNIAFIILIILAIAYYYIKRLISSKKSP